ncbi:glycosyltransferase family 2 protein [Aurantibacter sp.]|uniref:glycosyltransferase family 2 protein n=1 Tax=Aurantibacter sp. TaxID=2807103 RepID=UPI003267177C
MHSFEKNRKNLTALIITYNEIGYIEKCIESILFADEIIVVDSYSTDGTYEYLVNHPRVKVIQKTFENFTNQKAFALAQASYDWILFNDADEIVTNPLRKEIENVLYSKNTASAYWFYKKFMFKNKPLNFCAWRSDKNYRLFKKSKVKFTTSRIVHETLEVEGKTAIFKEKLIHYSYKDYNDYKGKMLSYGRFKAKEDYLNDKQFSYLCLLIKPIWKFSYHFLIRLGFLDTKKGFIVSYLAALGENERYIELRKLQATPTPVFNYKHVEV